MIILHIIHLLLITGIFITRLIFLKSKNLNFYLRNFVRNEILDGRIQKSNIVIPLMIGMITL